jgi:hypothetical protein
LAQGLRLSLPLPLVIVVLPRLLLLLFVICCQRSQFAKHLRPVLLNCLLLLLCYSCRLCCVLCPRPRNCLQTSRPGAISLPLLNCLQSDCSRL